MSDYFELDGIEYAILDDYIHICTEKISEEYFKNNEHNEYSDEDFDYNSEVPIEIVEMLEELKILNKRADALFEEWRNVLKETKPLKDKILEYRLKNRLYSSMSELGYYAGRTIRYIELVERYEDGTFDIWHLHNNDVFMVDKNGHLYYSANNFVLKYDENIGKYVDYHNGNMTVTSIVGYLKVGFEDEDEYDD